MAVLSTELRGVDDAALDQAARLIRAGQPVAVPTETVYGLAADATDPAAVARVYAAKGRPSFNPLIVHVADLGAAERLGVFGDAARALADAHWPGPLTLVVERRADSGLATLVTAGLSSVAIRVPAGAVMLDLIERSGRPLAAPSANASGAISPTRAEHVMMGLGGRVPLVLDGGATRHGLESTVVAATGGTLRLLRPGPVVLDIPVAASGAIESPGQLASHYAPAKPLRLNAAGRRPGEWLIGFGPVAGDDTLSRHGDPAEAAARLFDCLHRADASAARRIAVAPVPDGGLGLAINDRLSRAAA